MRLLFVCLGNICRSPLAEGLARAEAARRGLADRVRIDSAGTGGWHVGEPPDPRMQATARRFGIEIGDLRARQVQPADRERFDLILAMDEANRRDLLALLGPEAADRIRLLLEFHPGPEREVPDPYYGGPEGFERVFRLVERAIQGLFDALEAGRLTEVAAARRHTKG